MNSKKKISIIIPTYNEEQRIRECLNSLLNQTIDMQSVELLIIDGYSKDSTTQIVAEYQKQLPIKILYNDKRKTAFALNIGITNSVGDYIIRLDAHSIYNPDYIEKCIYYLETTECDNVGGVAITEGKGYVGQVIAEILSSKFGVGGSRFRTNAKSGYVDTVPFGAFRKEIFNKIGFFNTELSRSEDNDINARIRESGGKVYLASDIRFTYYCRNSIGGLFKQAIKNGNALFFTLKKNPKAMGIRHYIPFLFTCSIIILTPISFFVPIVRYIFLGELGLYFLLDLIFSLKGKIKNFFLKFILYPFFHFIYGMGSLLGLFKIKLY